MKCKAHKIQVGLLLYICAGLLMWNLAMVAALGKFCSI